MKSKMWDPLTDIQLRVIEMKTFQKFNNILHLS